MGLDMFLEGAYNTPEGLKTREFLYWRKHYPIMAWFDEELGGVENLVKYDITLEQLDKLKEWCRQIYKDGTFDKCESFKHDDWVITKHNQDFDEYLLKGCKATVTMIDELLNEEKPEYLIFHAWW